ncbi:MAG: flagellar hook capping FlgD N-terminal domain-containing protein [candidate division Zixibacteria bacterium]|jgi:flagellar basal-body rod modification protein FlgD|nr:flagellar hook capping FlgD N-terminal domain-containing protein [candidate division Zixibacteria bacterium]
MGFISPIATDASGNAKMTGATQSLGKDDFLSLLVTKLQYQDPLEPMADEDFIAQLAQFSSLEQMNNISEGIAQANEWDFLQMQSLNNALATNLLGRDVQTDLDGVYFDGENDAKMNFTNDRYATEIEFLIRNDAGDVIRRITVENVAEGPQTVSWDGKDNQGNRVPAGYYEVEASGMDADGVSYTPPVKLIARVDSITYRDGAAYLNAGGMEISLGDIVSVGEAGALAGDEDDG